MTDDQKIAFITDKLNEDSPVSSTGKILKMVLLHTIPTLQSIQLNQLVTILGGDYEEDIP